MGRHLHYRCCLFASYNPRSSVVQSLGLLEWISSPRDFYLSPTASYPDAFVVQSLNAMNLEVSGTAPHLHGHMRQMHIKEVPGTSHMI